MIASDVVRAVIGVAFIAAVPRDATHLLYVLSALLMFASPFFTSGRSSILPTIASPGELHTANALTQTTQWTTLTLGGLLAGLAVQQFGYEWAFVLNALSFAISAWCIAKIKAEPGVFRPKRDLSHRPRPVRDFRQGLAYMTTVPLILGIGMINAGWASGGGAAQILFGLFGENVFHMGSVGIGTIWGCAGAGLVLGGVFAHRLRPNLTFAAYKRTIAICYVVHGGAYIIFSQMERFWLALVFIALSRAAVAVSSVLNMDQLLVHVPDAYRGRVFATLETITWGVMMLSMTAAGAASEHVSPRTIGLWAGVLSSATALYWTWANLSGRLPDPRQTAAGDEPDRSPAGALQ
jgi:MFS family permease